MSKFITKFQNNAAYEAAESNLILPNVSYSVQENEVHFKPSGPTPPEYVEIDGIKWATMNVGATGVTDYGLFFQWADTQGHTAAQVGSGEGKKAFTWNDYKYTNDGGSTMSKYNSTDGKAVLEASDDAVNAAWGGSWRMPTKAEFQALGAAVNTALTQVNGVYGLQCTDKFDNSKVLFFPACGNARDGEVRNVGIYGVYWSGSLVSEYMDGGCALDFGNGRARWVNTYYRYIGGAVRGVLGA